MLMLIESAFLKYLVSTPWCIKKCHLGMYLIYISKIHIPSDGIQLTNSDSNTYYFVPYHHYLGSTLILKINLALLGPMQKSTEFIIVVGQTGRERKSFVQYYYVVPTF